ncbi:MAG TPA: ABC transporter ATP-binding protein [Alphaproteobacteria bacterium]|nr:ABC transporter ATP-binding protein [Alphaproteobacteria bacterium]
MLQVRDLEVSYGRIRAVQGISFTVGEGEIVALIGANGAGKSSAMHAVAGAVRPAGGSISFDGKRIDGAGSERIVKAGIGYVPEGRMIFANLSIEENLLIGGYTRGYKAALRARLEQVLDLFPVLRGRLSEGASNLSGGQQQMLALARGLMSEPRLLMLDEPSLGLSPIAAQDVFELIAQLRTQGVTLLLVEQNVRQALAIADRGYVIEGGRITMDGDAKTLLSDPHLVSAYLGIKREEMA